MAEFEECRLKWSWILGMFQQRYVKRHEIWHNPHIQNETWLFAAPKIRLLSGG